MHLNPVEITLSLQQKVKDDTSKYSGTAWAGPNTEMPQIRHESNKTIRDVGHEMASGENIARDEVDNIVDSLKLGL